MDTPILYEKNAVETWFNLQECQKWTLYATHVALPSNRVGVQDNIDLALAGSWQLLEKTLDLYRWYGDFFLTVTDKKSGGFLQTRLRLNGKNGKHPEQGQDNPQINGINAANVAGLVTPESVKGLVDGAVNLAMLQRDNEDLRAQIQGGLSPSKGLFAVLEHPTIARLVDRCTDLVELNMRSAAVIQPTPKTPENTKKTPKNGKEKEYKVGKMPQIFEEMQPFFPNEDGQDVSEAMIQVFKNAPLEYRDAIFKSVQMQLDFNKNTEGS